MSLVVDVPVLVIVVVVSAWTFLQLQVSHTRRTWSASHLFSLVGAFVLRGTLAETIGRITFVVRGALAAVRMIKLPCRHRCLDEQP